MAAPAGPARPRIGRTWGIVAGLVLGVAGPAAAQVAEAPPVLPAPLPAGPPPVPTDALFPAPVDFEVDAGDRIRNPNPAVASAVPTVPAFGGYKPLPGGLEDTILREYAARDLFRAVTWRETVWTLFPTSLLWEPPLANRREPRMSAEVTSLDNYKNEWTLTTSLGTTVSLLRAEPIGSAVKYQLDLFGVVHTRLSPDDVMLADYRFGFPVSFERGPWSGKIGYEHTSAHLGDEGIAFGGYRMTRYAKDELVIGVSRWFEDCVRVYGVFGHAFYQDLPKAYDRNRYQVGFEAYLREPTGWQGTPYAAVDL
ncbi:MAG: DUF1207 domain-containing protein, partial [Fimbriiglobus sp.]